MIWPDFMSFYSQLPSDKLSALEQSLTDEEFRGWNTLFEGLPPELQARLAEKLPPLVVETALTASIHLLRSYHDWLKGTLNTSAL